MEEEIRKFALINAVSHGGTAQVKAVISKLLGQYPELRKRIREVIPQINDIVDQVNSMPPEDQQNVLKELDPSFFITEKKEKRGLPPLQGAEKGKVFTRLPPEPNGYPHIGHGLSFYFNYYYAKEYNGKTILRFDDTNPRAEKLEFYDAIKEDLKWMGLNWEKEHNMSDDMELYYKYAVELIKMERAYICRCDPQHISKLRYKKQTCDCQNRSIEENLSLWEEMPGQDEGSMVLRLKADVSSMNTAMRDPTLFRIIKHPHPIYGEKYVVWPVYDFACSVEDSVLGITHVLRSNEFALRIELQDFIRRLLGLRQPITIQYSRFTIRGSPTAKRLIRPLIEDNVVTGWDDPRLVTLRGLRKRGIVPETIHELAKEVGLSTAEPEIDWSLIESINRKLIDPVSKRFFFVQDPVKFFVEDMKKKIITLQMHPERELGIREIEVGQELYIPNNDATKLKIGDIIRLKDLCNVKVIDLLKDGIRAKVFYDDVDMRSLKKIQWVSKDGVPVRVMVPLPLFVDKIINNDSIRHSEGLGEPNLLTLKEGEIVQFERYGFVRVDNVEKDKIEVILSHK